jgi:hypothetical protein
VLSCCLINMLTAIGSAPLLKEFEVSSASAVFYPHEWGWLPSSNPSPICPNPLPNLQTLTLQYAPFKPTSPVFLQPATQLHTLHLRALPASLVPLDRILAIVTANRGTLKVLKLHFSSVAQPVLPLPASASAAPPLALEHLEELYIGGHHLLSQLVDSLSVPQLRALDVDFDAPREPVEETIGGLCARSQNPLLKSLSISYGPPSTPGAPGASGGGGGGGGGGHSAHSHGAGFYYGYVSAGNVVSWAFLAECGASLEVLKVGGAALEGLLGALGAPEDQPAMPSLIPGGGAVPTPAAGAGGWTCPNLRELWLRGCHAHSHGHGHDGVGKLVRMVDARNPEGGSQPHSVPQRLVRLELEECVPLGGDVLAWLEGRIGKGGVVCVEPAERSPMVHGHGYVWAG